jgi:hypothetical protein
MKINCSKIILGLGCTLALAGCGRSTESQAFTNTYQGYPCNGHCEAFQKGYELAQAKQYATPGYCDQLTSANRTGCLSYVHEYQIEHEHDGGYVFPAN